MKIVHVCLCGNFGENYAYQDNLLPKYHQRAGHQVTIIASPYSDFLPSGKLKEEHEEEKILADGIKLIRLRALLLQRINIRLRLFKGLYNKLCKEKPNLIFLHGPESLSYISVLRYQKKYPQTDIVVDNHADWYNGFHSKYALLWVKYIINPLITKKLIRISSIFYGVTPARCVFLNDVYKVPKEKIKLLLFGADDDYMLMDKRQEVRANIRRLYGVSEDDFLIVTGGKLDRRKNIHILVEAVNKIENSHVKLLIFGTASDDMKNFYERVNSNRIIMVGWVHSNEVYKYFHASDLVFFPGLHSVLWEQSVACQKPSVFHRLKGFEHVNFNNNCLFVDDITVESCRDAIEMMYHDQDKYLALKKNAESLSALNFTYSKIAQKVIDDVQSYNDTHS